MDVRKEDGVEEEGGTKDGKLVLVEWVYKAWFQVWETSDGRRRPVGHWQHLVTSTPTSNVVNSRLMTIACFSHSAKLFVLWWNFQVHRLGQNSRSRPTLIFGGTLIWFENCNTRQWHRSNRKIFFGGMQGRIQKACLGARVGYVEVVEWCACNDVHIESNPVYRTYITEFQYVYVCQLCCRDSELVNERYCRRHVPPCTPHSWVLGGTLSPQLLWWRRPWFCLNKD